MVSHRKTEKTQKMLFNAAWNFNNPEINHLQGNRMGKSLEFPNEVTYPHDEIFLPITNIP
jgi:hypothetical protein